MLKIKTTSWREPLQIGEFEFSEFANSFHFRVEDGVSQAHETALSYLNHNYPDKAPFQLTRIETKILTPGATATNKYVPEDQILVLFKPLINTNWD